MIAVLFVLACFVAGFSWVRAEEQKRKAEIFRKLWISSSESERLLRQRIDECNREHARVAQQGGCCGAVMVDYFGSPRSAGHPLGPFHNPYA